MHLAYLVVTIVVAAMATFSGLGKLRRDPKILHTVHEVVGVPLKYFPHLAACEFAGALGLVLGIWLAILGDSCWHWVGRLLCGGNCVARAGRAMRKGLDLLPSC